MSSEATGSVENHATAISTHKRAQPGRSFEIPARCGSATVKRTKSSAERHADERSALLRLVVRLARLAGVEGI